MKIPAKLIRALEREKAKLAASRDRLRGIESEISEFREHAEEAIDHIERAADCLSELV